MPPIRRQVSSVSGDESAIRAVDSAGRPQNTADATGVRPTVPPPHAARGAQIASESTPAPGVRSSPAPTAVSLSRNDRIEQKLALAEQQLRELGKPDTRSQLLQAARLRRDEALIDAILASLDPEH